LSDSVVYIAGQSSIHQGPLGRFLPQIPLRIAVKWLHDHLAHSSWVIEPFGASPVLAVEAAREGYRVLVAANNPISRFLIEMCAGFTTTSEFHTALGGLATSSKGDDRIEHHIRSLYITECAKCGQPVEAQAFIWERDNPNPSGRIYDCKNCSDTGERSITRNDIELAARFSANKLHKARALERITPIDDPDRAFVEDALSMYLPRTLYALFTLINKLDSFSQDRRRLLEALLLVAFDQTNVLWSYPAARNRPRQLTIPPRFLEKNAWAMLESAAETWIDWLNEVSGDKNQIVRESVPIFTWPELPPLTGGICLFEGPLRALADQILQIDKYTFHPSTVITTLPRPNQAFWTLSAIWAGWLWGHHATSRFNGVLHRRRYDWTWHTIALHAAFYHLRRILEPSTDCLGLIDEVEPGFLSSSLIAAESAGFALHGLAMRAESEKAQITWKGMFTPKESPESPPMSQEEIINASRKASQDYLQQRGEPSGYLQLHAASLVELIRSHRLTSLTASNPATVLHSIEVALRDLFSYQGSYFRYGSSSRSLETGYWWLDRVTERKTSSKISIPLSDRVEVELVHILQEHPNCTMDVIDQELCTFFTGLLTPEAKLIEKCLDSYGQPGSQEGAGWNLRLQDYPETRHADMEKISVLIQLLGERLNYKVDIESRFSTDLFQDREFVYWKEANDSIVYTFCIQVSAIISEVVFSNDILLADTKEDELEQPAHNVIIIPGGRSHLVDYKIRCDPRLRNAVEGEWRFVKFRHLRKIVENDALNRINLDTYLYQDPLSARDPQLQLL